MTIKLNDTDKRPQRYGWAPGKYMCRCHGDGCAKKPEDDRIFIGDKRATMCADCAYALPYPPPPRAPLAPPEDALRKAVADAIERLGNWLTDNTENVFEEQPEIDGIRADLQDALDRKTS